jgi:(p)ppGpp synthase/HD superfamily hydrolase
MNEKEKVMDKTNSRNTGTPPYPVDEHKNREYPPKENPANLPSLLDKAIQIATQAHSGRKDKGGAPYILHCLRLLTKMVTEKEMIAAVLHDVVEDSDWDFDDLRKEGFSGEIVDALDHLTKRESEENHYEVFIQRVSENPMARKIKVADLEDNMNVTRLAEVTEKDLARINKYYRAWITLREEDDNEIKILSF